MRLTANLLWVFALTLFAGQALAATLPALLPPDEDPFYKPDAGYADHKPGTLLRWRKTPRKLRSIYFPINVKNSWQILVRSTDSVGNATAIVATIIEPYNADPKKLLSYQIAEDASANKCSPSYALMQGTEFIDTVETQAEVLLMQTMLEEGCFVVTPDYEGQISAFTAGRNAGHSVLDAIRAAYSSGNFTGIDAGAKTALWGYSGGTIASGWASALQPKYAPELGGKIIGAAMGGFCTNITGTVEAQEGKLFAGLIANGLIGLSNQYPALEEVIKSQIRPNKYQDYLYASKNCLIKSVIHYAHHKFFSGNESYFADGWNVFKLPVVQEVLNNETLGLVDDEMPQYPIFVFHGLLDDIVPFKGAERVYNTWCKNGIKSFEFAVDLTGGHLSEAAAGSPAAIKWLQDRFAGLPVVDGCKRTDRITNLLYPGSKNATALLLHSAVSSVLGDELGPNGENVNATHIANLKKRYNID